MRHTQQFHIEPGALFPCIAERAQLQLLAGDADHLATLAGQQCFDGVQPSPKCCGTRPQNR